MTHSPSYPPMAAVLACWLSQALRADEADGIAGAHVSGRFGMQVTELLHGIADLIASRTDAATAEPPAAAEAFDRLLLGGELITWNRAQATPPIAIGRELEVSDALSTLRQLGKEPTPAHPTAQEVARIGDMSPSHALRVGLDGDGDVYLSTTTGTGEGVEFCTVGTGGGKSPHTHAALVALMVAIEADNAADPGRDWWARRMGAQAAKAACHD